MGRRYHCELCGKSFKDNFEMRKKHLNGLQHQLAKTEHYQGYREPKEVLEEEAKKTVCRKFAKGTCGFGLRCNFSHYSEAEIDDLRRLVEKKEREAAEKDLSERLEVCNVPTINEWIQKYRDRAVLRLDNKDMFGDEISDEYLWTYPKEFERRHDLPPSLRELNESQFTDDNFATWG